MLIVGCDYHPSVQQIAWLDTESGECGERRLLHSNGEAEAFYRNLKEQGVKVRVGIEATGHARWFERLLAELEYELWVGDPAQIKAKRVRKQKYDQEDARLLLKLMKFNTLLNLGPACAACLQSLVLLDLCGRSAVSNRSTTTDRHFYRDKRTTFTYSRPSVWRSLPRRRRVTDEMFIEAGQAVADQVPSELLNQGLLYPLQPNILEIEIQTAARVAKLVFDSGLAPVNRPADMVAFIREHVYKPEYHAGVTATTKAA